MVQTDSIYKELKHGITDIFLFCVAQCNDGQPFPPPQTDLVLIVLCLSRERERLFLCLVLDFQMCFIYKVHIT